MKRCLSILGSTGSIGTQTLDVVRGLGLRVCALAANSNITLLENQIREFKPELVAVFDIDAAKKLKIAVADTPVRVVGGMEGLCEAAAFSGADLIVNAVVGMVGLKPTLAAIAAGKDVALANKETLVAGGSLVMKAAKENSVRIFPVDSEHSAIFQCLQGCPEKKALKRLILTASGGPFLGKTKEELRDITPQQALKHPNWNMGAKVTIDSATMMNKGLEIMEASWLFDMPSSKISVVVHRESVVHSMIEYEDNSVIAQLGLPDMRIPIQYAVTWPQRVPSPVGQLDLTDYGKLTFYKPDSETFTCLAACRKAIERGGLAPAAANGANEVAVKLFLNQQISFLQIGELVAQAMENQPDVREISSIDDILNADTYAREYVLKAAGK
ncbi:1-deoxy-D-xylulose-5-phosphate reductoisomerase [Caproiciproducens galactitolivorans]|uniref:1-deoxy-D-xylulose 5-phosphate reductoisomerase n=1 Tax=Caproiciproducens galactitolivorans TaxID=642589 RepID=A0ABT4BQQ1_9FIRM|nr:1-deoxy-D-xylulose-5-phosphate reductoisomerase [Caproiciproducens galactitolivorans]MCY1713214.1 1-deoxy-D-xylulose-5-phosphate reductoisomerase [Caproiciproducens galactitolivorans]